MRRGARREKGRAAVGNGCRWGGTPIQDAIKSGDTLIVQLLKLHGERVPAAFQHDALFHAARTGNLVQLDLLSAAGADFEACNYDKVCRHCRVPASAAAALSCQVSLSQCLPSG